MDGLNQQIAAYAKECGISYSDMHCMATGVVAEIKAMKSVDHFISHPESRDQLCVVALELHIKKFENFVAHYNSYPYKREAFNLFLATELGAA